MERIVYLKEIGTCSNSTNYFTPNIEACQWGGSMYSRKESTNMHFQQP